MLLIYFKTATLVILVMQNSTSWCEIHVSQNEKLFSQRRGTHPREMWWELDKNGNFSFFVVVVFGFCFVFFSGFFFFNFCFLINAEKKNNYLQYDCWHYNTILATYTTYATILYSYSTHLYTNTYITYNTMVYLKYASYITCSTFFFN